MLGKLFLHSPETLRKGLGHIQNRLSKLIDMYLDGAMDSEAYQQKLGEYKKRQQEITPEMKAYVNTGDTCLLITAKTVLDWAKGAKEIFTSSKLPETQR
ncbi:hypothetical protein [Parachlamydia sp. AcF125]|uniref:hypothetical protein n=1 Tax=Parachlamydia sp. AcF125 TaxID=2795736 RepID=UPI001BC91844|nr:hypothetical protein [Parachlamydia sp. AcF125]MBS4168533.1 hypothetical protein [Parachlamydia sp. AcF125]